MFEIARENHYQLYTCCSVSAWILRIPNESVQALIDCSSDANTGLILNANAGLILNANAGLILSANAGLMSGQCWVSMSGQCWVSMSGQCWVSMSGQRWIPISGPSYHSEVARPDGRAKVGCQCWQHWHAIVARPSARSNYPTWGVTLKLLFFVAYLPELTADRNK